MKVLELTRLVARSSNALRTRQTFVVVLNSKSFHSDLLILVLLYTYPEHFVIVYRYLIQVIVFPHKYSVLHLTTPERHHRGEFDSSPTRSLSPSSSISTLSFRGRTECSALVSIAGSPIPVNQLRLSSSCQVEVRLTHY